MYENKSVGKKRKCTQIQKNWKKISPNIGDKIIKLNYYEKTAFKIC
jgi:hypothetical protein